MDDNVAAKIDEINNPPSAPEYEVMLDAYKPPAPSEKTFSAEEDGLKKAAAEVAEKRAQEPEPTERFYTDVHGDRMLANQTVSLERSADDLARQRGIEQAAAEDVDKQALAWGVDAVRAGHDPVQLAQQALEQQQQARQTQPEIQPQPQTEMPGVDPEIADALQRSPKLRAALEQEAVRVQQIQQGVAQAHQQYAQATHQAHDFAVASMIAAIPELQGLSAQQLPAALHVLRQSNPARHAEAVQHLARIDQLGRTAVAAKQHQAQAVNESVGQWVAQQDAQVDEYLTKNEDPSTVRAVKDNLVRVLGHYGVDAKEFGRVLREVPFLRSAPVQKMLYDLAKVHVLRDQTAAKVSKPVPPVQRPGTSQPRSSHADGQLAEARARFFNNPNDVRSAADFLLAKRAAKD